MKVILDIPQEFEKHFNNDRFKDSLKRIIADVNHQIEKELSISGLYEIETCEMLIEAFKNARAINKVPTIKAKPMKYGKWIYGENEDGQDGIFCSECDHFVPWYYDYYDKTDDLINDNPRCPNCGVDMRGDDK